MLGVSLDRSLLDPDNGSDAVGYCRMYGRIVDEVHMVVLSGAPWKRSRTRERVQLAPNVYCYPTGSQTRGSAVVDGFRIGNQLITCNGITFISTQDCFATGTIGYLLKRKHRIPLLLNHHGDVLDNRYWQNENWWNRLFNLIGKWLIHRADTHRVVSRHIQARLRALGVPEDRIWRIECAQPFHAFVDAEGKAVRKRYLGGKSDAKLLLWAGRAVKQKDLPTLIRAMEIIVRNRPGVVLIAAGEGPLRKVTEEMVLTAGLHAHVVFCGSVPYREMPAYFAACDAFVLSSTYEGNARVLAEAAAAGRPVVATDVSGTRDTVLDGVTGYVVPPREPAVFAAAVLRLLSDSSRAQEMGLLGKQHVITMRSEEVLLPKFMDLYASTARAGSVRDVLSVV